MRPARTLNPADWFLIITVAANVAGVLFLPVEAFVWQIVVDLLAASAALGYLYLVADDRAERTADELLTAEIELAVANGLVDRLRADIRAARPLRSVPAQRPPSDSWLEAVMDEQAETWPTDGGA